MDTSLLKACKYFAKHSDENIARLAAQFKRHELPIGHVILQEGSPQELCLVVEAGVVERAKAIEDGNEFVLDELTQGQVGGLLHLLKVDPSFCTYRVSKAGEGMDVAVVWMMTAEEFRGLLQEPAFACDQMAIMAWHLRSLSKTVRTLKDSDKDASKEDDGCKRIRVCHYDSKAWVVKSFDEWNTSGKGSDGKPFNFRHHYVPGRLTAKNAALALGSEVVCCFVNDTLDSQVVRMLADVGVRLIAMRCAGYDRVDLDACNAMGITVVRVPGYSPYAVAEHSVGLLLALNRKINRAANRTKEYNFSLDGLLGWDLHGRTAGVVGTGRIGQCLINILLGFGCKVLCYDLYPSKSVAEKEGCTYVDLDTLLCSSDFISLHCPLTPDTHHMINKESIAKMKKRVYIINESRGGLIDTEALIAALNSGQVGAAGLDVYEGESDYFFKDMSDENIPDSSLQKLAALNNVILTGHQGFFTKDAIDNIACTTLENILVWSNGKVGEHHPNVAKKM
eukprot:TRINITY_DN7242_c0_g1_i1.p1 TRINITY_DN7242_c0_g1~~TRINITY_DN7242_c0_g1_i1.p1  ORF type:complete len:529 (-),score=133.65 TRINITY_DN7242_c0_g1_i1:72-1592(-)